MRPTDDETPVKIRSENVTWRELGDDIVILDLERSVYLTVSGAGTLIWKLAASGATLNKMIGELRTVYDVTEETARADVAAFLADLRSRNLIEK